MDNLTVLNATPEGDLVFVLLSDDRIFVSRQLDDKNCAEIFARQIVKLRLEPKFLVNALGFQVAEGL